MTRSARFLSGLRAVSGALLTGLALAGCGFAGAADPPGDPTGIWWVDRGGARVEISEVDGELRGRVVWLRRPFGEDGCELLDQRNPDTDLRGRTVLGLELLRGLRRESPDSNTWTDGELYDPNAGGTYRGTLTMRGPDELELRGYIGIELIGRSVHWFRFGNEPVCKAPAAT
jgi:uncharacterized protein (DUF2147 family)